ncbi:MAG: amidohydrolase, partial [Pseudomonadota bacterium]
MLLLLQASGLYAQYDPAPAESETQRADLILRNGIVHAESGLHSALAVDGPVIIAVGDDEQITELTGINTRIIDLEGASVFPGLHDMHVHPALAGFEEISCKVSHRFNLDQIFERLEKCVAAVEPGEWVIGRAYDPEAFGDAAPHRSMLDAIAPNNPVLLNDISGHSAWVNSKVLELAGYTADTPNPDGGIIERDAEGVPTGLLHETAMGSVYALRPEPSRASYRKATRWALDVMLSNGITSLVDASTSEAEALAYADLYDEGYLKQRVRSCVWAADTQIVERRNHFARERFRPDCVKLFLDGVPTDSHTAAMVEPYLPKDGTTKKDRVRGILMMPAEKVAELTLQYDSMGLVVKYHAAGDQAVRTALDAIAAARQINGMNGLRHNPGHTTFIQPSDIARAKALGATLEFSPYLFAPSPIVVNISKAIGGPRMARMYALREAVDAGVHVVVGSDWPVVPFVNPWIAIELMVTRQRPGGSSQRTAPSQGITLSEAIDMFTIKAAEQMNMASFVGSIAVGKFADLAVVDQNVFAVPITRV